jgi:hypothetical protein
MINLSINDQSTAHSAAQGNVKNRIKTYSSTTQSFAQRRDVGVIVNGHGRRGESAQPLPQIEFRPTFYLMRPANPPLPPIYRPAKSHANRSYLSAGNELWQNPLDLMPNAFCPITGLDRQLSPLANLSAVVAQYQLQLGSADFNAH